RSEAKKVPEGTHSCWECKRRKIKCKFDPLTGAAPCNGCRRRGSRCISQEFPEEASLDESTAVGNSWNGSDSALYTSPELPKSTDGTWVNQGSSFYPRFASQERHEDAYQLLRICLPSRKDIERIRTACRNLLVLTHETLTMPYNILHKNGLAMLSMLLDMPESDAHPVFIARHMLRLATFLQQLHLNHQKGIKGLSVSPRVMMDQLADLAIRHVTTDELLCSLEGLECMMLEALYQANLGNIQRSRLSCRRAMSIAQLMGLHRLNKPARYKVFDSETKCDAQHLWFRIVFWDRYLSLMLGISEGCTDRSMISDSILARDTPMGRLERIHCVIASQILERNESNQVPMTWI
ncbi:c6 zinc finger domain containing protein, partial [Colletotrichum incanum]